MEAIFAPQHSLLKFFESKTFTSDRIFHTTATNTNNFLSVPMLLYFVPTRNESCKHWRKGRIEFTQLSPCYETKNYSPSVHTLREYLRTFLFPEYSVSVIILVGFLFRFVDYFKWQSIIIRISESLFSEILVRVWSYKSLAKVNY